ncbi:MAG: hypothetical protein E7634_04425 [Ruminococcaceae bacterium]|nr:hypothetical protein [Oscillospiraceae bacterium]
MRNPIVRKTALLLAFLMLFSVAVFAACGKEEKKDPANDNKWHLSDEPGRPSTPDGLPEDLDLGGYECNVLYRKGDTNNYYECEGSIETGENFNPVYQTVYERNKTVEWRLNCKLTWIPTNADTLADTQTEMARILQTQEYYDFISTTNNTSVQHGLNALLCDLSDTAYIDLGQPWWWSDVNDTLSVDNYRYNYITGDMHVSNYLKMSAFYFNVELVESMLKKDKAYMYGLVDDGKWTIEQLYTMIRTLYKDTTVDPSMTNKRDQGDVFGMVWASSYETIMQFVLSTRVAKNTYERDSNGVVTMNLVGNEDVVNVVDVMRKLLHETEGAWMSETGFDSGIIKEFSEGNYVFLPQRLTAAPTSYLRDMRTDYGILPYPTLEEGDEYISDIQTSSASLSVQAIVELEDNLDTVSAIIEALGAEAYRYTTVAFYELALKAKYARDDDASRMIDIIAESAHKSFIVEYGTYTNNIMNNLAAAIRNDADVTSSIAGAQGAAQTSVNNFISKVVKDS